MGQDVGLRRNAVTMNGAGRAAEEVPFDVNDRAHYTGGRQGGMLALLISQAVARD